MPGKVGVKIKAGRNLPVMDRGSDTTDAYVEIKLGNVTHKTDVCRKSLNPQWNTDWFRFEVDDAELQDEPLQIRLMDYDTYSANDAIGKVNISLNPLCLETSGQSTQGKGTVLSGWIPVFDTMHGIRGEVNVIVKVDLFSDLNKFRQSSCGIQFFHSQCIPHGYRAQVIHGFVEELVVNDDPEYQWIDKIRTPRASNEARQVVFLKLSGQVQRKMGLKAINMGANAVIGYTQCFDLEGDVGVVARGIGTAVTLIKDTNNQPATADNALIEERTLKYLEFLIGGTGCKSEWPEYKLQIRKSHSSTLFELKRSSEVKRDDHEIMLDLIRQEDERGEKPVKKLKHHMRRITHSSKNLLNEKYAAFIRKISDSFDSEKSHDSITKSLSSLFSNSLFIKEEPSSTSTVRSSIRNVRKPSLKAKKQQHKTRPLLRSSLKKPNPIVRSISDDSAMKNSIKNNISVCSTPMSAIVIDEFQDNTRSSPNITTEDGVKGKKNQSSHHTSGVDSDLEIFSMLKQHTRSKELSCDPCDCGTLKSSSSTTISLTISGSSTSDETDGLYEEDDTEKNNVLECSKIENILKICNADLAEERLAINWMKPGCADSIDDSLPEVTKRYSFLRDLKSISQHMQDFIHITKKSPNNKSTMKNTVAASHKSEISVRRAPPNTLMLPGLSGGQRKSYYSSQPEILNEMNVSLLAPPISTRSLSRSLTDLNKNILSSQCSKLVTNTASCLFANTAPHISPESKLSFPVLQICPSTPTPSESDNSQISQTNNLLDQEVPQVSSTNLVLPTTKSSPIESQDLVSKSVHVAESSDRKPSNSRIPFVHCLSTSDTNTGKSSLLAPSTSLFCIKHHRSLNELNASTSNSGTASASATDSPNLKRFTSPASAASASGSTMGSRSKLSPSPSKTGITSSANTQSDYSTASTASTMIPKEVGEICRRSSDSDLSVTPKGNSFCVASERLVAATALMRLSQSAALTGKGSGATDSAMDMLEYPFLTMTKYPPGFILHLGATVAARSVKLLERVPNPDEPEVRDSWWTELRMEIRSHARALGCNVVLGYSESTTISDDVCVLSATGTAAVINMAYNRSVSQTDIFPKSSGVGGGAMSASLEDRDITKEIRNNASETAGSKEMSSSFSTGSSGNKKFGIPPINVVKNTCAMCHIPYNLSSVPFNAKMKKCAICRKGRVPDVLLATLEVPEYLQVTGRGCFMQAQVVRAKKDLRSELNAKEISDGLPFLEYELHRVLINKLKAKGMNAIFGLKAQVAIGERMIALIATGTALFLTALPVPQVPKIVAGNSWTDKQKLNELQKKLQETFERNQEIYQLKCIDPDLIASGGFDKQSDTDESDEEAIEIDLNCGNKDTCVLEVDDIEDLEIISLLMEPYPPEGFHVVNTQMVPGMMDMEAVKNLQMFTQVWRAKLEVGQNVSGFPKHFQRLLQTIYFKLRTMIPCAICDLRFRLDLPESDQIQLLVTGMALGLGDANNKFKCRRKTVTNGTTTNSDSINNSTTANASNEINGSHGQKRTLQEEDYIFPLDEDQMIETPTPATNLPPYGTHSLKLRKTSPSRTGVVTTAKSTNSSFRNRYFPLRDRYGVDITPLSFIPGGKIEKYLGNLNFFFIRESTSIRENGGISGFVHGFITELLAVVRAHIASLGGNAMVSFYMTELILVDNQHKNQGQCLISIGGDAVYVSYYSDD